MQKLGLVHSRIFAVDGAKLEPSSTTSASRAIRLAH
jgi:hypothetical protein